MAWQGGTGGITKHGFTFPVIGDLAQWLVHQNSNLKNLGLIPWRGKVCTSFYIPPSPSQLLCRLVCAWPPFVHATCTQIWIHVKDPIFICHKRVGLILIANGMDTRKQSTQEKSWVAPYYGCSLSLGKAAQIYRTLHWDKKLSNLIKFIFYFSIVLLSVVLGFFQSHQFCLMHFISKCYLHFRSPTLWIWLILNYNIWPI